MDTKIWESQIETNQRYVLTKLMETTDNMSRSQLEDSFCNLIKTDLEIIQELIDTLLLIKTHQKNTRIMKTSGTTVGTVGAFSMVAGLCLSPVTGGMSAALSIGGLIATATSGVAAIGSEIFSRVRSKAFIEHIEKLQERQALAAKDLTLKLGIISHIVDELRNAGVSDDVAIRATFTTMKNRMEQVFVTSNGQYSPEQIAMISKEILKRINEFKGLASTVVMIGAAAGNGLSKLAKDTTAAITKLGQLTTVELQNVREMLQSAGQAVSSSTGKIVLKRIGAVAGIIFTVIDIAFLIKEWKTPHPLIRYIQDVVDLLIKDVEKCDEMVQVLQRIEA